MLLDTSGLLCFLDASERRHPSAVERNISEALSTDRHFVQAGFQALLIE